MLYYTAPEDELFEEVRRESMNIWKQYDDTYGYASGKVERIKDIKNVGDNFMYMVAMFDYSNQKKLIIKISPQAKEAIKQRMIDGGNSQSYIDILFMD